MIINPYSGNKKAGDSYLLIKPILENAGCVIDIIETIEQNHAFNICKNTNFDVYDTIVVIGGDGTLNEVINGLMIRYSTIDSPMPSVGLIPGGTGNSVSVSMGIDDPIEAAKAIVNGYTKRIDLGKITMNDGKIKYMINLIGWGLGVDANVTAESLRCCGPLRYDLGAVWQILLGTERRAKVNIDGEILDDDFSIILILNNQHGGSRLRLAPYAKLDDGCLDVLLAKNQSRSENIHMFDELKRGGSHVYLDYVIYRRFKKMMLESLPSETLINVDGENEGTTPFTVEVVKHAISMFYKM